MDLSVLNPSGQKIFPQLHALSVHEDAYLAGGTAVALHLNHRYSFDLDMFTPNLPSAEEWKEDLQKLGDFEVVHLHPQSYVGKIDNVQISLATYKHSLLEEPTIFHDVRVVGLKDLAAMKLFTLLDRSRRRDVYDLYFMAQEFDLTDMLLFFEYKFEGVEISEPIILKFLSSLDEMQHEKVRLIRDVTWDEVKNFWRREVKEYARDKIGSG